MQVMLGVDRLDMIKGIPQKLLAFEKFLDEHPEWSDKVLLVQIAVPSRTEVPEYQVRHLLDEIQHWPCIQTGVLLDNVHVLWPSPQAHHMAS